MNKNPNTHKNLKYVKVTKKNIKQNSPFYISTNNIKNSNNYKTSAEYQIKNFNTIENGPNNIKQISQIQLPTKKSNLKGNSLSLLKNKLSSNQSLNSLNPKKSFNCCNSNFDESSLLCSLLVFVLTFVILLEVIIL